MAPPRPPRRQIDPHSDVSTLEVLARNRLVDLLLVVEVKIGKILFRGYATFVGVALRGAGMYNSHKIGENLTMIKTQALKSVVFAAIAAGLSSVGLAADYWASPTGGGAGTSKDDPTSLAAALAAANAAGEASTVHLTAGEYPVSEQIAPAKDVKILGAGAGVTSLIGTDALTTANKSLLYIAQDGVEVCDLTVTNGIAATSGAGVVMTKGVLKFRIFVIEIEQAIASKIEIGKGQQRIVWNEL